MASRFDYQLKFPQLALLLYRALKQDPFYAWLEQAADGGPLMQQQAMFAYYDFSIDQAWHQGQVKIAPENSGVAIWQKPAVDGSEQTNGDRKYDFILSQMGHNSLDFYQQMGKFMSAASRELVTPNAWYLSILGVAPERQGQGLGKALLKPTLADTDRQKVPCFLETFSDDNIAFYQAMGFHTLGRLTEPSSSLVYTVLGREPAG